MECLVDDRFIERVGLNLDVFKKQSNFAFVEEGSSTVHFLPTKKKGFNYVKFLKSCKNKFDQNEIIFIINQYTYHDTWYCTKINLLLASDSAELEKEINYIRNLDQSIKNIAKITPIKNSKCFRGMQMSLKEFDSFPLQEFIFIPSFLSTSQSEKKIYQATNHNALIEIKLSYLPNNAILVSEEYSVYAQEEEEILFSCYSRFKILKKKNNIDFNGKNFEFYLLLEHTNSPINEPFEGILGALSVYYPF